MTVQTDLIKLYSTRILSLATDMPNVGRLPAPSATVTRRSPLCGSKVTVDILLKDGKITAFGQEVKACALGQAAASIFGHQIIGLTIGQVQTVRDELDAMLKSDGPIPNPPFSDFEILTPAKDYKNRHASIMLVLEATTEACLNFESAIDQKYS